MLFLVYHHLGDSWKSAREASTSRLLCFTTGFPGAPKGSPLQLFPNGSNAVHRCGNMRSIAREITVLSTCERALYLNYRLAVIPLVLPPLRENIFFVFRTY